MEWLRWYHGTSGDSKWRVVARKSQAPLVAVVSIWSAILENASESVVRGTLMNWNSEDIAARFDLDVSLVVAIVDAMQGKVLDGDRVINFEKRNPKRERPQDVSTERVREWRKKRGKNETPCNATQRLDKSREEKIREEGKGIGEPRAKRAGKTPVPTDFEITSELSTWATAEGFSVREVATETVKMQDHFRSKGERRSDWIATWRNWMRNSRKFGGGNSNGQQKQRESTAELRERQTREASARLLNRLAEQDGGGGVGGPDGSSTGGLHGEPSGLPK